MSKGYDKTMYSTVKFELEWNLITAALREHHELDNVPIITSGQTKNEKGTKTYADDRFD